MPGGGEGVPGDVEPAVAREQLIGVWAGLQILNQLLEFRWVCGADVGCLTQKVLRVTVTPHERIDTNVAKARVDDDGTDHLSGGLQQHLTAVGHVYDVL